MNFIATKNKPAWPRSACEVAKLLWKPIREFVQAILCPLKPYESDPTKPDRELPEDAQDVADEQLMQCHSIFDASEARRTRIEQKAQWLFSSIAFLMPALGSVLVFLTRDSTFQTQSCPLSFGMLIISASLLTLCFIAALRAMWVRPHDDLYIHSVIDSETGNFLDYRRDFHARGLLYCAIMNTARNDHVAQFVKSAQILLMTAVLSFVLGLIPIVYDPWCPTFDTVGGGREACELALIH